MLPCCFPIIWNSFHREYMAKRKAVEYSGKNQSVRLNKKKTTPKKQKP